MSKDRERIQQYFDFLAKLPLAYQKIVLYPDQETWIVSPVTRPHDAVDVVLAIEMMEMESYQKRGLDPEDARLGIIYENSVAWMLNDPICVPGRTPDEPRVFRGWNRYLWKNGVFGKSVVILAVTPDKRVAMIPADRHPAQRWELEFIGDGYTDAAASKRAGHPVQATWEDAIKLQVLEEAGYTIQSAPIPLFDQRDERARFVTDPSSQGTLQGTFLVRLGLGGEPRPQFGEVIDKPLFFTIDDLERLYLRGWMAHPHRPGVVLYLQDGRNGHALALFQIALKNGLI